MEKLKELKKQVDELSYHIKEAGYAIGELSEELEELDSAENRHSIDDIVEIVLGYCGIRYPSLDDRLDVEDFIERMKKKYTH